MLVSLKKQKIQAFSGEAARKEIAQIKKLLEKQYAGYIGRNGASAPELEVLLKGIINTRGLEEKSCNTNW